MIFRILLCALIILSLGCGGRADKIPLTWSAQNIPKEDVTRVELRNGSIGYLRMMPGNKDVVVYLNPSSESLESVSTYMNVFNMVGFDALVFDYAPKDSTRYTEAEVMQKISSGLQYLHDRGYAYDKIVVYGKGNTCLLTIRTSRVRPIRGIVLENISDIVVGSILKEAFPERLPVLILQSVKSKGGAWQNGVSVFSRIVHNTEAKLTISQRGSDTDLFFDSDCVNDLNSFFPTAMGMRKDFIGNIW